MYYFDDIIFSAIPSVYNLQEDYILDGHIESGHEKLNIPFSFMLCLFCKKPIGELNLKRVLNEDTGVFSFFFPFFHLLSSSSPLGQTAVSGNSTLHQ